jgi:hypothetical protein
MFALPGARRLRLIALVMLLVVGCTAGAPPSPGAEQSGTPPPPLHGGPTESGGRTAADEETEQVIRDSWAEFLRLIEGVPVLEEDPDSYRRFAIEQRERVEALQPASECTREARDEYREAMDILQSFSEATISWQAGLAPSPFGEIIQDVGVHAGAAFRALENAPC